MKKQHLILLMTILAFGYGMLNAYEAADLTGIWEGTTYAESAGAELVLTLVLEQEGDGITGSIKDDMGYLDCAIEEATLIDDVLNFKATAITPVGDLIVSFAMEASGSTMEGEWEAEDGSSGTWNPTKK